MQCKEFKVIGILSSPTAIKESILHSDKNAPRPLVSIMSRYVIQDDIKDGKLFEARIKNQKIQRKFYIAYLKDKKHDVFVDNVINYLLAINKI